MKSNFWAFRRTPELLAWERAKRRREREYGWKEEKAKAKDR